MTNETKEFLYQVKCNQKEISGESYIKSSDVLNLILRYKTNFLYKHRNRIALALENPVINRNKIRQILDTVESDIKQSVNEFYDFFGEVLND